MTTIEEKIAEVEAKVKKIEGELGFEKGKDFLVPLYNVLKELQKQKTAQVAQSDLGFKHLEFPEGTEREHKQELLDRIKQLEAENDNYKEEVKRLKTQLEQLTSQHIAQIEVKANKK